MSLSLCQSVYQSVCLFLSLSVSLSSFSSVCQSIRTAFFRCLTETLTSQIILSYPILLNRLYPILSHNIPSYLIPYYRIISYSFSVHSIISYHTISYLSHQYLQAYVYIVSTLRPSMYTYRKILQMWNVLHTSQKPVAERYWWVPDYIYWWQCFR